jgi:hypothetical protein
MKTVVRSLALASLFLLSAGGASAGVTVVFSNSENYSDLPFASGDREEVLNEVSAHFAHLAAALPAGQELKVEVLDIDLAGRIEPSTRGTQEIRILRGGADWPHMHFRYTLEAGGQVLSSGDERLSNMTYLDRMNRYPRRESLRYEKQMLDEWFRNKFVAQRAS